MTDYPSQFKIFDQVRILTTKNVKYLSAPPGSKLSPHGIWQVSGAVQNDLLLVKNNVTIKIPVKDILLVFEHSLKTITHNFGKMRNG